MYLFILSYCIYIYIERERERVYIYIERERGAAGGIEYCPTALRPKNLNLFEENV